MQFSILRLLIVMAIVTVWLGVGSLIVNCMPAPIETRERVCAYVIAGPAIGLTILVVVGVWYLAGDIEKFIRQK